MGLFKDRSRTPDMRARECHEKAADEFSKGDRKLRAGDEEGASQHYKKAVRHQLRAAQERQD